MRPRRATAASADSGLTRRPVLPYSGFARGAVYRSSAMKAFASVLIGLVLALPAGADMLQKKSGTFIEGKILEVTEKGIRIQLAEGGEATVAFEDLDPFTVYKIRDKKLRDTGKTEDPGARFALGRYAMENG